MSVSEVVPSVPRAPGGDQDAVRAALVELVRLKDVKTRLGETADYREAREEAWAEARRVLGLVAPGGGK